MGLNKVKEGSQMYQGLVSHTWNPVRGLCYHNCEYCYCKAFEKRLNKPQPPTYLDEKEFKTNLGHGNFIFVGSANDLFAEQIPKEWIVKTLDHCNKFDNRYFFQTKNPCRLSELTKYTELNSSICTTVETNRWYGVMGNALVTWIRADEFSKILGIKERYVTIEPILDFDLDMFVRIVKKCRPDQVNIGADSGHNNLPEPPKEKILELITELEKFTTVYQKSNLKRLLK